ncbi:hypothetical protein [Chamaesiphon sp.]|uniref:hypothetical protein n=1 Tax=Chamaesiphon sp. TaxID=2814140 RepID=UPI0035939BAF
MAKNTRPVGVASPTENRIPKVACHLTSSRFARSNIYAVVAEVGGQIVGNVSSV